MAVESVTFDLDVIVNNINAVKELEALVEKLKVQIEETQKQEIGIKTSNALQKIRELYEEINKVGEAFKDMTPKDAKGYKAISQYASSLKSVVDQVGDLQKELSKTGASKSDTRFAEVLATDLQNNLNDAQKGIDSYVKKLSNAENAVQKFSNKAVKIFTGRSDLDSNNNTVTGLEKALYKIKSLDPDLELVNIKNIDKAQHYVEILQQIKDITSSTSFDSDKFQKLESDLKDIGIQTDTLQQSFESFFTRIKTNKLTSLADELKTVMGEVESKLKNGFSGADEVKKYKDQVAALKNEIKSLDKAFDYKSNVRSDFWETWNKLVQQEQNPNGKRKKKKKSNDSIPEEQTQAPAQEPSISRSTPESTPNTRRRYQVNSRPPKLQQTPPPSSPPTPPPPQSNSIPNPSNKKITVFSGIGAKLESDFIALGNENNLDPEITKKALQSLKSLASDKGMSIDSYKVNFLNNDDGIQARTVALKALNEETGEAINLTMQFDEIGKHLADMDVLSYTNDKNARDRKNAQKQQTQTDQKYSESINKQIAAEKELAKYQHARAKASVEDRGQYDDKIAAQQQLIQYEKDLQQQLQVSNEMQTKGAERLQTARERMDTYYRNLSSTNILNQFDGDKIADLSNTIGDNTKLAGYTEAVNRVQQSYADLVNFVTTHDLADNANMEKAENQAKELQTTLDAINNGSFDKVNKSGSFITTLSSDMEKAKKEAENLVKAMKGVDESSLKWAKNGSSLSYRQTLNGQTSTNYANIVSGLDGTNQLRTISTGVESSMSKFVRVLGSGLSSLKGQAASIVGMYMGFNDLIRYVQQGISVYKDYDAALTDISYTTEGTTDQINAMGRSYVTLAKDLSSTVSDSMKVASIYANLQTTSEEVMQSVKPTLMLANTTGVDASTASDQIQGVLEQFDLTSDQSEHVVDVFESISSNLKLDFGKAIDSVAEGVQAAGQSAADAGMTFEQLSAVIGKVAEKTRDSGSEIGNSLKTILTRISKASTMADDVDNESISKAAAALHSIGVEVYEQDGTFRNFIAIITELQQKWDSLTDAQQANIAYEVAATRQTNRFKLMLDGWVESMSMAEEATNNSDGYAEELQEKYENSFNGKLTKLKATSDEFWINFMDNDATKGILDFVTSLTEKFTELTSATNSFVSGGLMMGGGAALKKIFSKGKDGEKGWLAEALG